jgi:hypothetical protein
VRAQVDVVLQCWRRVRRLPLWCHRSMSVLRRISTVQPRQYNLPCVNLPHTRTHTPNQPPHPIVLILVLAGTLRPR